MTIISYITGWVAAMVSLREGKGGVRFLRIKA
jgi:hypothetical protein